MKTLKKICFTSFLVFNILILGVSSLSTTTAKEKVNGWKDTCCGSTCGGEDYCYGSGEYICCK